MLRLGIALVATFVVVTALVSWWAQAAHIFSIVSCNGECYTIPVWEANVRFGVIVGAVATLMVLAGWAVWHSWGDTYANE